MPKKYATTKHQTAPEFFADSFARLAKKPHNRVTFIFGAGLSIALSPGGDATWVGLMKSLVKKIRERHQYIKKHRLPGCTSYEKWTAQEALAHRLHTIQTLVHGDSDAVVSSTYLVDRLHRLHMDDELHLMPGWTELARYEDVNEVAWGLEIQMQKALGQKNKGVAKWEKALQICGNQAKKGKALLVTTNFDHTLAMLSRLPVYVGPQHNPIEPYRNYTDGLVILRPRLNDPTLWLARAVQSALLTKPGPLIFNQCWTSPNSIPATWWRTLASIFHVHGSRLVPPSLVFDPISYWNNAQGGFGVNAGDVMNKLFDGPSESGPIIFVGCGGTILDPHFVSYWKKITQDRECLALMTTEEANDRLRELSAFNFDHPPIICDYGSDFNCLPTCVAKLALQLA